MAVAIEYIDDSFKNSGRSSCGLVDAFQLNDPRELFLKQDEINAYISYQRGILWDIPRRILEHPDLNKFHLHGDKSEAYKQMELAGHAILDWQFNGGEKRIMRIASYAFGHHPGYGVLIHNGLSEEKNGVAVGKETVMERTIHFNQHEAQVWVNDFHVPQQITIVDDRFVTRYPDNLKELMKTYNRAQYLKDYQAVREAKKEALEQGYDFEFFYGQSRVVIPGSAIFYPF